MGSTGVPGHGPIMLPIMDRNSCLRFCTNMRPNSENIQNVASLCRGEALQLQSQLSDAQDEAQLLRRLLTLCNQALTDTSKDAETVLADISEEQQSRDSFTPERSEQAASQKVTSHSLQQHCCHCYRCTVTLMHCQHTHAHTLSLFQNL